MTACLNKGIKITIIHNIDRRDPEMISAVERWFPLYLSGNIEPYYVVGSLDTLFTYTLFIAPENACIESFSVRDIVDSAEYRYITQAEKLEKCRQSFESLKRSARPLMECRREIIKLGREHGVYHLWNTEIALSRESVIVNRLTEAQCGFYFTLPEMIKAFENFIDDLKTSDFLR